ncbi:acyltransferase domain-containing protein [Streptomyces sp. NPDC006654]|uniref:ACP S-malonyltransferase n=1 Tax=Streptomyces sp. NPDC006654 TaxID=3156897 RepID=UPI0033FD6BD7
MTTALFFPGQGSQHPGMGRDLFPRFPELTEAAETVLGYSLERLCLENPDGALDRTLYTQPAVYTVNALAYRQHILDGGASGDVFLGHSLGEYNALEAAGVIDFATGLRLVAERARLMTTVPGGMAAVIGPTADQVQEAFETAGPTALHIAAYNSPRQLVIAGSAVRLAAAAPALHAAGARRVVPLKVSGPFHTPLMTRTADTFATTLASVSTWREPAAPVISNHLARPHRVVDIVVDLTRQLDRPVQWDPSVRHVLDCDPDTTFVEIGDSTSLLPLVRQIRRQRPAAHL